MATNNYPLPNVNLPKVDYSKYSNPQRGNSPTPGASMVKALQQADVIKQRQEEARLRKEAAEEAKQQRIIEGMQRIQVNADLWNLEQMSNLHSMPKSTAIEDQLRATLQTRLDIATQAQVYLKTKFDDKGKRASAQKAVADYYDLLNLTKNTIINFSALGTYWKDKAPTIGSAVTIIGNDENEIANNQYLVNALGGVYDDAKFEMLYDENENDIMIKVSGHEHVMGDNGKMELGEYREKILSARAWNTRVGEGKDFQFVSEVPQIVNETIEMLKPSDQSKNNDGIGVLNNKGIIAAKYWIDDVVVTGTIPVEGGGNLPTSSRKKKLNLDLLRTDMEGVLKQKIGGVVATGPQQTANFWNIDLKQLNKGFGNSYQKLLPDNTTMEQELFNNVIKSLTSFDGITTDEDGNIFYQTEPSVGKWPEGDDRKMPEYRYKYLQNVITPIINKNEGKTVTSAIIDSVNNLTGKEYYARESIYPIWLENIYPPSKGTGRDKSNKDYYTDKGIDPQTEFNKLFPESNSIKLYERSGGKLKKVSTGGLNLDTATGRLEFVLNQMTQTERKAVENETEKFKFAWAADWKVTHPQKKNETTAQWVERMRKAYKKAKGKNYN